MSEKQTLHILTIECFFHNDKEQTTDTRNCSDESQNDTLSKNCQAKQGNILWIMPFIQHSRKCKLFYMIKTEKKSISGFLRPQGKERMDHKEPGENFEG